MPPIPHKIFNDPVYGFISLPTGLVLEIVEHPYFQRLRRIKQLGLTHYIYPGALHTRLHHALGAVHLMTQAIEVLRSKGTEITDEEAQGAQCAILLHDIGHGPFSHALEHRLVNVDHESLTLLFMQRLDELLGGRLGTTIEIFNGTYPKAFLHQLISGQLDMDRLDYLTRDSFFTGVHEGVVGTDRIIKMLAVHDGQLVVEEKGIYSIEKFLIARRLMYWQAYLHKTSVCAENMLIKAMFRAKKLLRSGVDLPMSASLRFFLEKDRTADDFRDDADFLLLEKFARLDDYDVMGALKEWMSADDFVLRYLSQGLIDRRLFKVEHQAKPFDEDYAARRRGLVKDRFGLSDEETDFLFFLTTEKNRTYSREKEEILILGKNGLVKPLHEWTEQNLPLEPTTRHFLCYPKALADNATKNAEN
jgi:HD superfamily phosphohydrolase